MCWQFLCMGGTQRMQVLEDIALSAQMQLVAKVPFCAFNGGRDVFVDVGNKSLGLGALMVSCWPLL